MTALFPPPTNCWAALLGPTWTPPRLYGRGEYGVNLYGRYAPVPGNEVAGHCYARVPCTLEVDTDGIDYANVATLQWPMACGSWGGIGFVAIYDAASGGNQLATAQVTGVSSPANALVVNQYDRPRVPAGGLVFGPANNTPVAFGLGGFGVGPYGTATEIAGLSALLLLTFGPAVALCGGMPGDWAPRGPFGTLDMAA